MTSSPAHSMHRGDFEDEVAADLAVERLLGIKCAVAVLVVIAVVVLRQLYFL